MNGSCGPVRRSIMTSKQLQSSAQIHHLGRTNEFNELANINSFGHHKNPPCDTLLTQ